MTLHARHPRATPEDSSQVLCTRRPTTHTGDRVWGAYAGGPDPRPVTDTYAAVTCKLCLRKLAKGVLYLDPVHGTTLVKWTPATG